MRSSSAPDRASTSLPSSARTPSQSVHESPLGAGRGAGHRPREIAAAGPERHADHEDEHGHGHEGGQDEADDDDHDGPGPRSRHHPSSRAPGDVRLATMSPPSRPIGDVLAAGAVVIRKDAVLLVHRPRYGDWSFPKGKLDRGELAPVAAVREVGEETGVRVRLGTPLRAQRYPNGSRMKTVSYWHGRVVGDHSVEDYRRQRRDRRGGVGAPPQGQATAVLHLRPGHPRRGARDRVAHPGAGRVRHAHARARKSWRKDDRLRPLLAEGKRDAAKLVPLLGAYGLTRLVTSSSVRCAQTLVPYAEASGWPLQETDALSQEDATAESVLEIVDDLLHGKECAAICTHRPVLPTVLDALEVVTEKLAPGELVVVHHRKGKIAAFERY